jgi:hypothetical protein
VVLGLASGARGQLGIDTTILSMLPYHSHAGALRKAILWVMDLPKRI